MLLINLKTAFRYLKKNLQFTTINIFGLTLGFFCFFLLNSYVLKETSFDLNQKEVYRLLQKSTDENGGLRETAAIAARIGSESKLLFDEIENQTQILEIGRTTIGNDPSNAIHEPVAIMDNNFLRVFDFKLLEGDISYLKKAPHGIILNKSLKERYFGMDDAINKNLKTGYGEFPIVGVLEDFPINSHFENQIFFTTQVARQIFKGWDEFVATDWSNNQFITYLKILPKTDLAALEGKITTLTKKNIPKSDSFEHTFSLQPIHDIHLYANNVEGEINKAKGNALYVKLFFWLAIFILLVACFNYAGLQNITFMDRSKEIGLRRIVGAEKTQLLWQFLSESLILTIVSMVLAYTILWVSQPLIHRWFDASLNLDIIPIKGMLITVTVGLLLSLLSIAYPFWLIIRSGISSSLKQSVSTGSKLPFRRFMLVFQSMAVIAFLTASLVFSKQMDFLKSKDLGFEVEGLATVDINSRILRSKFESIKEEFLKIPEVKSVSVSSRVPGEWKNLPLINTKRMGQDVANANDMLFIGTDKDFLKTFEINLLEGKNFTGTSSDSTKVILNQSAVASLGLESPVGRTIEISSANFGGNIEVFDPPINARISGIVEDFQMEDFRTSIKPLIIGNWNNPIHSIDYYTLRINTKDWASTLLTLKEVNDSFDPNTPIEFNILEDKFARFYEADMLRFKLLNLFSGVIVLLACLGLFSMSAFVARSRTKEIGIRKVVGASFLNLLQLLSQDFVKLMLIGFVIAAPITWHLLKGWLTDFAYSIDLKWWMFALTGLVCLVLTILTVSVQTIKAALANPVKSLRTE
jgi:putative ABC transport system permease protein